MEDRRTRFLGLPGELLGLEEGDWGRGRFVGVNGCPGRASGYESARLRRDEGLLGWMGLSSVCVRRRFCLTELLDPTSSSSLSSCSLKLVLARWAAARLTSPLVDIQNRYLEACEQRLATT